MTFLVHVVLYTWVQLDIPCIIILPKRLRRLAMFFSQSTCTNNLLRIKVSCMQGTVAVQWKCKMAKSKYMYYGWKRKLAILFYLLSLLTLVNKLESTAYLILHWASYLWMSHNDITYFFLAVFYLFCSQLSVLHPFYSWWVLNDWCLMYMVKCGGQC